jgi:hypothetical protein
LEIKKQTHYNEFYRSLRWRFLILQYSSLPILSLKQKMEHIRNKKITFCILANWRVNFLLDTGLGATALYTPFMFWSSIAAMYSRTRSPICIQLITCFPLPKIAATTKPQRQSEFF